MVHALRAVNVNSNVIAKATVAYTSKQQTRLEIIK